MAGSKGKKVDPSRFAMVPRNDVPRSAFDASHVHKTTFDAGLLVPIYVDEVLPGDSFRVRMTAFARLSNPITPVMDNLHLDTFFFFVPNRLVWSNWARFMGEQSSPTDTTEFLVPTCTVDGNSGGVGGDAAIGKLADYFGITLNGSANAVSVNALPWRGYNLIWNTFFRDEDLQEPAGVNLGDGPDLAMNYGLRYRGKRHDYFTSARPWPQKPMNQVAGPGMGPRVPGGPMTFPQAGVPVSGIGVTAAATTVAAAAVRWTGGRDVSTSSAQYPNTNIRIETDVNAYPNIRVLINDMRTASMVQTMMERNSRGGTRYTELLSSHFGVTSPDARLQRPEFLGGGHSYVNVSPVAQQSASGITGSTTVLGELAGIGTVVAQHGFSHSFVEHGFVIGLACVRSDLTYGQGIERFWRRRTMYDYYWPALAHLGEQAVLSREIYADGSSQDDFVFGYQERWAEYRHKPNRISGRFRNQAPSTLNMWHFSQHYSVRPTLGSTFIAENPPVGRVLQVTTDTEQFLFDGLFDIRYVRAMPMFSIPGMGPRL